MNERTIFMEAMERATQGERAEYLDAACAGDRALRARVEALLRSHDDAGKFLGTPVPERLAGAAPDDTRTGPATSGPDGPTSDGGRAGPATGALIGGRYKLIEQIGEGGMGTVWLAQQQEPVKRPVAVKLIKPGMDSKQVLARFEAERQALALMDHPHIAKVHDAGTTPDGRPFFVMELVKGVPITRYCDDHRLTTRQRLDLFLPVCHAIQHAHQKGVIHRDLKPSNVLVAPYDGRPVPKVIDFGVAKAAGQPLTDKTLMTGLGAVVGTPEYMSPEQAELNNQDIDTRSDVYALGVLLYELLTGGPPFTKTELERAGMLEMLRVIREQEPSKPSTKLSSSDALPTLSANRGTEPAKLTRLVRGELDWIVMKALEKDRNRRYETANGFALDVQRYLADESVLACPPSAGYRLRKFARRNKTALAVAALVLFFLVVLGSGIGWAVRDRAAQEAAAAKDRQDRETAVGEEVEAALREASQLVGERKWAEATAAAQRAEGALAGGGGSEDLRRRVRDLQADLKAVARLEEVRLRRSQSTGSQLFDVASSDTLYANVFRESGIEVDALDPAEAGRRVRTRLVAQELAAGIDDWTNVRFSLGRPGWEHLTDVAESADPDPWRNRLREAWRKKDRQALVGMIAADQVDRLPPMSFVHLAAALNVLDEGGHAVAVLRRAQQHYPGDFWVNYQLGHMLLLGPPPHHPDEATGYFRAAVAVRPESAEAHSILGLSLAAQGDLNAAVAAYQQAIAVSPDFAIAHHNLGDALYGQGKWDDALTQFQKSLELDPTLVSSHVALGYVYAQLGRWDQAAATHAESGRWVEAAAAADRGLDLNPMDWDRWCLAATLHAAAGDPDGYRRTCEKMLARFGDTDQPQPAERITKACSLLPGTLSAADSDRVQKLADRAVTGTENDRLFYWFALAKGLADYRAGRYAEAVQWVERFPPNPDGTHWDALKFAILAMAQDGLGSDKEARASLANAARIIRTMPDPGKGQLIPAIWWHDWVHAQVLCREAEGLLKKK